VQLIYTNIFQAPGMATGLRKSIWAGCRNLVLKIGHTGEPHEFIPTRLMSNHAQCDSTVVLPAQQRRAPSSLQWAHHNGTSGALEVWRASSAPASSMPPSQCPKASPPRRSDGRPRPLDRPPSGGTPVDGSSTEDGRDGSARRGQGPRGVPYVG